MSHLTGIAFESPEVTLAKLRERLRSMSDEELIKFGKQIRALSGSRVSPTPDPWKEQLEMAREEWRRRHRRTCRCATEANVSTSEHMNDETHAQNDSTTEKVATNSKAKQAQFRVLAKFLV